ALRAAFRRPDGRTPSRWRHDRRRDPCDAGIGWGEGVADGGRNCRDGKCLSSFAPPFVLPDISPTRGEIGSFRLAAYPLTLEIGEIGGESTSPPQGGRCPAGQRGAT